MVEHDYDWIVIGSGFGGSVSALRLAQKGYRVAVIESGRRFADDEFAERSTQLRRVLWLPRFGLRGILRMTLFRDVMILSGCGVGGGSLVYAQTLYRAGSDFTDALREITGETVDLGPFYAEAERMLGVTPHPRRTAADRLMARLSVELCGRDTFQPTPVGVYFGEPGVTVDDPYFGGDGPARTGCVECGGCMLGCRHNAKNTLPKNYLWLAERLGVTVLPERTVTSIAPIGGGDGADGYAVTSARTGAWLRTRRETLSAGGVVVAAGALGTNRLLAACKHSGALPRLSDRLGHTVRTNSESMTAVTFPDDQGWAESVAITGSIFPDADNHVETTVFGPRGGLFSLLFTLLTPDGNRLTRPLALLWRILANPMRFLRSCDPRGWARRTVVFPVMQPADNSMRFVARRRFGRVRLSARIDQDAPIASYLPLANEIAARVAHATGGLPQSTVPEVLLGIPMTAHLLGGAIVADSPRRGVVDARHRVFGYRNLLVCDGAAVPANPGVNPSLTITAMAERAMAAVATARDDSTSDRKVLGA